MKLKDFLLAMILISLFMGVIIVSIVQLEEEASDNSTLDFNQSAFSSYDQREALLEQSKKLNESLKEVRNSEEANPITFASAFVASGWRLLKTTFTSFDVYTEMSEKAIDQADLGASSEHYRGSAFLFVFILFAFAVVAVLLGREP